MRRPLILVFMALAVITAAASANFAFATEEPVEVVVSGGARSCEELNKATGKINGAPEGAELEFTSSGLTFPAVISGNSWSVVFNVGTPPATSFPLHWRVFVVNNGVKEVIDEGDLQIPACTPVTSPPTTPPTVPPTTPPTPPTAPPSEPSAPPTQAPAPAPSRTVAKTS